MSAHLAAGQAVSILYSPSARTRETAEEIALGLADGLRQRAQSAVHIALPRAEPAICNFHITVDGQLLPPTDAMDPSFPSSAARHPYLQSFWSAQEDRIGYWLSHPSECVESPGAVAARLGAFFRSTLQAGSPAVSVLITHSGPMRAFLRAAFGTDPGEPAFCEWFRVNGSGVHYRSTRADFPNGSLD